MTEAPPRPKGPRAERDVARLHRWVLGALAGVVVAGHHAYRAHLLYVAKQGEGPWGLVAVALGLALGALVAWRAAPWAKGCVPWLLLGTATAAVLSSFAPLATFDDGWWAAPAACACVAVALALASAAAACSYQATGKAALALGLVTYAEHPLRLLALLSGFVALMSAEAYVGFLRAGIGVTRFSNEPPCDHSRDSAPRCSGRRSRWV